MSKRGNKMGRFRLRYASDPDKFSIGEPTIVSDGPSREQKVAKVNAARRKPKPKRRKA